MTKTVFLMRHGEQQATADPVGGLWDTRAPLSEKGASAVKQMAAISLQDEMPAYYGASPLLRAYMTAHTASRALHGYVTGPQIHTIDDLGPGNLSQWDWLGDLMQDVSDPTPRELFIRNTNFILTCGARVNAAIQMALDMIQDGESALLVSHQPLVEAGVAVTIGKWPVGLNCAKGGIYRLEYTDGQTVPKMIYLSPT